MKTQLNLRMYQEEKEKLFLYAKRIKSQDTTKYIKSLITSDSGIDFADGRKKS